MSTLKKNIATILLLLVLSAAALVSCGKPAKETSDDPKDSTEHPSDSTDHPAGEHPKPADSTKN
jgi:ABC-type oligopeptide transport system substrate-binding subunit